MSSDRRFFLQQLFTAGAALGSTPAQELPRLIASTAAQITATTASNAVANTAPTLPTVAKLILELHNAHDAASAWFEQQGDCLTTIATFEHLIEALPQYAAKLGALDDKHKAIDEARQREAREGKDSPKTGEKMAFLDDEIKELNERMLLKEQKYQKQGIDFELVRGGMQAELAALQEERRTMLEASGLEGLDGGKYIKGRLSQVPWSAANAIENRLFQLETQIVSMRDLAGAGRLIDLYQKGCIKAYAALGIAPDKVGDFSLIDLEMRFRHLKGSFWANIRGGLPNDHPKLLELLKRSAQEAQEFSNRVNSRPAGEQKLSWQDMLEIDELLLAHDKRRDDPTGHAPHPASIWRGDIY